jgi:hypothetical protein
MQINNRLRLSSYEQLAVPGHALLWLIPVQRKRTNPMPVGNQYFCGSIFCADI